MKIYELEFKKGKIHIDTNGERWACDGEDLYFIDWKGEHKYIERQYSSLKCLLEMEFKEE